MTPSFHGDNRIHCRQFQRIEVPTRRCLLYALDALRIASPRDEGKAFTTPLPKPPEQTLTRNKKHRSLGLVVRKREMGINSDVLGGAAFSAALKRPIESNSPTVSTPARTSTPPPPSDRARLELKHGDGGRNGRLSSRPELGRFSALDADAVDSALRRELNRSHRDSTPGASPHRKRQRINGDRSVKIFGFWQGAAC